MYQPADFQGQLILIGRKNRGYPTLIPELQAISAALNTDPTTQDLTIALPPLAVRPGADKTPFTNEALILVNRGKGGNLANATMAGIINGALGLISPPINTVAPVITFVSGTGAVGSQLACSPGTWSPTGTPTRQWLRNGNAIPGATATAYTAVLADVGTNVSCAVTAMNAAGEATALSNAVAITALGG